MKLSKYTYLLPLILAAILFIIFIIEKSRLRRFRTRGMRLFNLLSHALNVFVPNKDSRLSKFYAYLFRFTKISVEALFKLTAGIFLLVILMCMLIKFTNVGMYTEEIFSKFDYKTDLIYQSKTVMDENEALSQEILYFKEAIKVIHKRDILLLSKEDIENKIKSIIHKSDVDLYLPKVTIANKIYYRLADYYKFRSWNFLLYIIIACVITFIPEACAVIYNSFAKSDSKKELRFLKRLIILNGSIKPVDFMELLKILIEKAKYHKRMLIQIEEMNKSNSINNRKIYNSFINNTKDIDDKLFYEKLDQANNYDFDQAIINIENEFKMEKRSQARKVRKQIEFIHAIGIVGFMLLIVILIIYLIIPWIKAYSMNQIL